MLKFLKVNTETSPNVKNKNVRKQMNGKNGIQKKLGQKINMFQQNTDISALRKHQGQLFEIKNADNIIKHKISIACG